MASRTPLPWEAGTCRLKPALILRHQRSGAGDAVGHLFYWGYYNICFLGGEVRRPERTIPRAILISVAHGGRVLPGHGPGRAALAWACRGTCRRIGPAARADGCRPGRLGAGPLGWSLIAALIVWTAFASVFSLLLGYSRVPYAAARDGNYFRFLAALHPRHGIPHRSLVALGLVALPAFCFFTLAQVITFLVVTRILLQFSLQHVGVIWLRVQKPNLDTPLPHTALSAAPAFIAMAGFIFILVNRAHALGGLAVAAADRPLGDCDLTWCARAAWGIGRLFQERSRKPEDAKPRRSH